MAFDDEGVKLDAYRSLRDRAPGGLSANRAAFLQADKVEYQPVTEQEEKGKLNGNESE
jgi:hypothetical protein